MDIGHFYSPPTEPICTDSRTKVKAKSAAKVKASTRPSDTGKTMVDNKGWRQKISGKPKDLPPIKTTFNQSAAAVPSEAASEPTDRRHHGWRKTLVASRPLTPLTPAPTTPAAEELDDITSERSEASAPRRDSKPKLIRYTSLFATHKGESTSPNFSEPWSVDAVPGEDDPWSYVDPIVIVESIHSHMCKNYMVPVPIHYTSGLFQIFDDYRRLRSQKEALEVREREALERSRNVTARLFEAEDVYEFEIRRLELLIARGTSGMTGLMQARQGTVVDREGQYRKTISTDQVLPRYQRMSSAEVDAEIKAKSQQVHLNRPSSPSGRMAALSRQLTSAESSDLPIGTPPNSDRGLTLSRRVKSELDMGTGRYMEASFAGKDAYTTIQSSCAHDNKHRVTTEADQLTSYALECDALVALKELGALVACRRGLDVTSFVSGLMALLGSTDIRKTVNEPNGSHEMVNKATFSETGPISADDRTHEPPLHIPLSCSYQGAHHEPWRHFSFEPGDDQLRELEHDLNTFDSLSQANSTDSHLSSSAGFASFADDLRTSDDGESLLSVSGNAGFAKPSLIPSPIQTTGRVRRGTSMSSLQSVFKKPTQDDRHTSRTSIQTAFREATSANRPSKSQNRSSSTNNLRAAESPLCSKERQKSVANRRSTAALAAARAAESKSSILSRSGTQASTATISSHKRHGTARQRTENTDPITCENAEDRDAK